MSKLSSQYIDIFAAGNHGAKGDFREADLDQIVANYKPDLHEAPAVIGHPKDNAPAFGWAESLRRVGGVLQAKFKQVVPQFEEAVEAGRFKKRSVSLYKGPEGWSLRHVGFLGAQPPEIKGLADIKFASEDTQSVDIDFEESSMAEQDTEKLFAERMTAWFKKTFGEKVEAKQFSEQDFAAAIEVAVAPLRAQLATQVSTFAESQKTLATVATKTRAAEAIAQLKRAGKWVPAFDRTGLAVVFDELATQDQVVEFGEGATRKSLTPLACLVNFLDELPVIVPTTAVYTGQTAKVDAKPTGINDTERAPVDPNSMTLHALTLARMGEQKVDYGTAMNQIATEKPELTRAGSPSAGGV